MEYKDSEESIRPTDNREGPSRRPCSGPAYDETLLGRLCYTSLDITTLDARTATREHWARMPGAADTIDGDNDSSYYDAQESVEEPSDEEPQGIIENHEEPPVSQSSGQAGGESSSPVPSLQLNSPPGYFPGGRSLPSPPSPPPTAECIICIEPVTNRAKLVPCGHAFNYGCISQWVRSPNSKINNQPSCPLCRNAIKTIKHSFTPWGRFKTMTFPRAQPPAERDAIIPDHALGRGDNSKESRRRRYGSMESGRSIWLNLSFNCFGIRSGNETKGETSSTRPVAAGSSSAAGRRSVLPSGVRRTSLGTRALTGVAEVEETTSVEPRHTHEAPETAEASRRQSPGRGWWADEPAVIARGVERQDYVEDKYFECMSEAQIWEMIERRLRHFWLSQSAQRGEGCFGLESTVQS